MGASPCAAGAVREFSRSGFRLPPGDDARVADYRTLPGGAVSGSGFAGVARRTGGAGASLSPCT